LTVVLDVADGGVDPGREQLEPAGAGRGEEALSGDLAMH